jgi:TolB-like protein/cytochrome c-type biogenesis protein CcmH/NrfG
VKIDNFFSELKRRNVIRAAGLYLVGAWLLTQVSSTVLPMFGAPDWLPRSIVVLLAIGFIPTLIFSWVFELTPQGLKRDEDVPAEQSIGPQTGRRMNRMIIAVLLLALAYFAVDKFVFTPRREAALMSSAAPNESKFVINAKSIAVLPFENLSSDKENAFFTDGVQDEILTDLAKIADLKVISRTSVMQYKDIAKRNLPEIAQALKVAHVLEGSVQRASNHVRVNAQLIDARTDAHLWAQRFDGDLADVFAIQGEIAQKIVDQLKAVLSPKEQAAIAEKPTNNVAAYDLYLRAREIEHSSASFLEQSNKDQLRLLEQAVALDPAFVTAFCSLARAHLQIYWFNFDHTETRLEQAKKAIDAAARLQPDAGELHFAKALFRYWGSRDYAPALAELDLAHRALPNDSDVLYFVGAVERRQGRFKESVNHIEESLKLDPHNASIIGEFAATYMAGKRYPDAVRVIEEGLRWKPNDFVFENVRADLDRQNRADLRRLQILVFSDSANVADPDTVAGARLSLALDQRDFSAAKKALADYKSPDFNSAGYITPREVFEGQIARGAGDKTAAQSAFLAAREKAAAMLAKRPEDPKVLIVLADIDARLGRKDEAVREGEHAVELLPVTKDALDGPNLLTQLADIYTQVGQPGRALDLLERAAPMPWGPSYGDLKLGLDWDPLRKDPRFEKIVASLAPKDSPSAK